MDVIRAAFLCAPAAVLAAAWLRFEGSWSIAVFSAAIVALIASGCVLRWKAVPGFIVAYWLVSAAERALFWADDPALVGLDDPSPLVLFFLTLPVMLVPVVVGAAAPAVVRWWTRPAAV